MLPVKIILSVSLKIISEFRKPIGGPIIYFFEIAASILNKKSPRNDGKNKSLSSYPSNNLF